MKKSRKPLIPIVLILASISSNSVVAAADHHSNSAQNLLDKVVDAMGGEQRIKQIQTQQLIISGKREEPEQTFQPGDDPLLVGKAQYVLTRRFDKEQFHTEWNIDGRYPFIEKRFFTEIINYPHAAVIGVDSLLNIPMAPMRSNRMSARIKHYDLSSPIALIQRAISNKDKVKIFNRKKHSKKHHNRKSGLIIPGREQPVRLVIDRNTNLPVKAVTLENDSIYGDTRVEFLFKNWARVNNAMIPHRVIQKINGIKVSDERREAVYLNLTIDQSIFAVPEALQQPVDERMYAWGLRTAQWLNRYIPSGVPFDLDQANPQSVQLIEIAPNTFHIRGLTHNSLVIEMKDYLILVDPVLYEERTQIIIPEIRSKWPNKNIRYVIPSHFHIDHIGGVRGYAAIGADLIVGEGTDDHYEKIFDSPHSIYPDEFSKNPRKVSIHETDEDDFDEISDGERSIQLLAIPNRHAIGTIVPYIEDVKMIFVSDLYNPEIFPGVIPPSFSFWARDLYDALQNMDLDIQWLVGAHGGVTSYEKFEQQVLLSTP